MYTSLSKNKIFCDKTQIFICVEVEEYEHCADTIKTLQLGAVRAVYINFCANRFQIATLPYKARTAKFTQNRYFVDFKIYLLSIFKIDI